MRYKLNFPNLEIEIAFEYHLLGMLTEHNLQKVSTEIERFQEALYSNNTKELHQLLVSHLAAIPYAHRSNMEENYQNILFSIFRLLGAEVELFLANKPRLNKKLRTRPQTSQKWEADKPGTETWDAFLKEW